jgi:transposase
LTRRNDRNDAEAIAEAAGRPNIHPVPVKSAAQQAAAMVLKVRDTLVCQRTLLINTLRGHATEFGVIAAKGTGAVGGLLKAAEAETTVPQQAREMLALLGEEVAHLDSLIKEIEVKLLAAHRANPLSVLLATSAADAFRHIGSLRDPIPGIGPITALTLALEIDAAAFESGRHLASWIGLTPPGSSARGQAPEHSTGGKQRMGGISRAGNERLRQLLVLGATSVIAAADRPGSTIVSAWLLSLLKRKPRKVAAVALANKMARIVWAELAKVPTDRLRSVGMPAEGMMKSGEVYRSRPAAAAA